MRREEGKSVEGATKSTPVPGGDGDGGHAVREGAHGLHRLPVARPAVPHLYRLVVPRTRQHLVVGGVGHLRQMREIPVSEAGHH